MEAIPATIPWTLTGRTHESGPLQQVLIDGHLFTIGRHPDNDFSVPDATVSGCHAEIVRVEEKLFVRDLESTNGTMLNGRRLQSIAELCDGDILHFGTMMFNLAARASGLPSDTIETDATDVALGQIQFDKLLNTPKVRPDFQPIVRLDDRSCIAYEALSRSQLVGLETPDKMFRVAAERTQTTQLSEVCRYEAMRVGKLLGTGTQIYLNTHPSEMGTPGLHKSLELLRRDFESTRIMLEIHESAVTSSKSLKELRTATAALDISLAYDDFGSGQTRLMELAEVPPEVLKFDIKIIRGLPTASETHLATIRSLINIARDLNVIPLAEGVETEEEAGICKEIGFELAQGYLFGRPERVTHWISNELRSASIL